MQSQNNQLGFSKRITIVSVEFDREQMLQRYRRIRTLSSKHVKILNLEDTINNKHLKRGDNEEVTL